MVCKINFFSLHLFLLLDFDFTLSQIEVRFIFGFLVIVSLSSIQSYFSDLFSYFLSLFLFSDFRFF